MCRVALRSQTLQKVMSPCIRPRFPNQLLQIWLRDQLQGEVCHGGGFTHAALRDLEIRRCECGDQ